MRLYSVKKGEEKEEEKEDLGLRLLTSKMLLRFWLFFFVFFLNLIVFQVFNNSNTWS